MDNNHKTINISTITILKVLGILLLAWVLWLTREILLIFLIAVIVSSAIDPVVEFLHKRKIPRALGVLMVYLVIVGIIVAAGFLFVPPLMQQFESIKNTDVLQSFTSRIGVLRESLAQSAIGRAIDQSLRQEATNLGSGLFQTTKGVLTGIISLITVFVISFYLTAAENGMKNFVRLLAPFKHQGYVMNLVTRIQHKMGSWVLGQIILSIVIFGLVFLGLTILNVKYALVLALVAAIFEVVPIIGPYISGTIGVFFAFLQSPALAVAVLVMWSITQQLESHVVVPIIMSRSVGINPVLVILGILVGGTLGGIVGALIAIPVISGVSVFVWDLMEGKTTQEV